MITDVKTIILERDDLKYEFKDYLIDEISLNHFEKSYVFTDGKAYYYDIIIFLDNIGQMKIFKNRFGDEKTYEYNKLIWNINKVIYGN